jgi:hypothetical protein
MPNMSYCRFENTLGDLVDCFENINKETNSRDENYRQRMIDLFTDLVENCNTQEEMLNFLENEIANEF